MHEPPKRDVTPEFVAELLRPRHPGVEVVDVTVLGDTSGSANRLRLGLTYAPGRDSGLPATMFLKRNLERFTFPIEVYSTEVHIYRDVLPRMSIETPTVYGMRTTDDSSAFAILMEDLSSRAGVRIGFVLDPVSVDDVDSVLDTVAALHSRWWASADLRHLPWATPPAVNAAMKFWADVGPRLTRRHLKSGHRAAIIDEALIDHDWLWTAFERMVHVDGAGVHTLLHGDLHAGNVYYVAAAPGGLLDWQLSLRGNWALDVAYLITSSMRPEDRRVHERSLLKSYLQRLRSSGIDAPSPDEAWTRYRQNALYGLMMWLITPDGVHSDEAQLEYLRRCMDAVDDLQTLSALQ